MSQISQNDNDENVYAGYEFISTNDIKNSTKLHFGSDYNTCVTPHLVGIYPVTSHNDISDTTEMSDCRSLTDITNVTEPSSANCPSLNNVNEVSELYVEGQTIEYIAGYLARKFKVLAPNLGTIKSFGSVQKIR
jgi:hypothetical protein